MAESEQPAQEKPGTGSPAPGTGMPGQAASLPTQNVSEGPRKVPKRDANFRRELLKKLPQLSHAGWSIKENFKIDEEWGSVLNLRADPLLEALEKIAPERLR